MRGVLEVDREAVEVDRDMDRSDALDPWTASPAAWVGLF